MTNALKSSGMTSFILISECGKLLVGGDSGLGHSTGDDEGQLNVGLYLFRT